MEQAITIKAIEEATSRANKTYWKVQTDQGNMSCFEKEVADQLIVGQTINLEIVKSGQWTNIRAVASTPAVYTADNAVKPGIPIVEQAEVTNTPNLSEPVSTKTVRPVVSHEKIAEALVGLSMGLYATSENMSYRECSRAVLDEFDFFVDELE